MSNWVPPPERVNTVRAFVESAAEPPTTNQIVEATGMKQYVVSACLSVLSANGHLTPVRVAESVNVWCHAGNIAALRAKLNAHRMHREATRSALRRARLQGAADVPDLPVRRAFIKANDAPPLRKIGPASVWELAA